MRSAADRGALISDDKLTSSFGCPDAVARGGDRMATQAVFTVKDDSAIPVRGRRLLASVLVLYAS